MPSRRGFLQAVGVAGASLVWCGMTATAIEAAAVESGQGSERRYPVPPTDGVSVDRDGQIIIARNAGRVYAFSLSCPHQNNVVKWLPRDHRFQCTKHDSQYQLDGTHTSGRATRNMDRFVIRKEGDAIIVDLRHWLQSDKDPQGWAAASVAV